MRDYCLIYLNGLRKEVRGPETLLMLGDWLRKEAGLTGTKIVCAEGDCGACTVLRAFPKFKESPLVFEAMNSCIATVAQMDGSHLVTVEGIQRGNELSPVQKAMRECHGSQCGFCTPGFIMALSGAFEKHKQLSAKTAQNYLTGNLCRCTGYQPIIDAALATQTSSSHSLSQRYLKPDFTADLISAQTKSLLITTQTHTFFAPASLSEAVAFTNENPGFRVLGAATDFGVQTNKGKPIPKALLSLHLIPDLYEIQETPGCITVGARVPLAELRRAVSSTNPEFSKFLDLFASPQIKNVATLVGNIANASPIGDTLPFLLISDGQVHVASQGPKNGTIEKRLIPLTELYLGYKSLSLKPNEIITHVSFRPHLKNEIVRLYKSSQRKDLDISTVSGAFSLVTTQDKGIIKVQEARIALGGVAATPIRVPAAELALKQQIMTPQLFQDVAQLLANSVKPQSDLRGSQQYRKVLVKNLFKKFGDEVLRG